MVDVSKKEETYREASACATVLMKKDTLALIRKNKLSKGDCLATAKIAGIMAAKKVSELIPLTHPIEITDCVIDFKFSNKGIKIFSTVKTKAVTGVEMEALTAVALAGLTIYDMAKGVDRGITIKDICLLEKKGGKSGYWKRREDYSG